MKSVSVHDRRYLRGVLSVVVSASVCLSIGCSSSGYLMARKAPLNPLAATLGLFTREGPHVSKRTEQVLRRYDLSSTMREDPRLALERLHEEVRADPTAEKIYAFAELAYVDGLRAEKAKDVSRALDLYSASVAHAYYYLFDPRFDPTRNPYDPQFRGACDLYNVSLESAMRIVQKQGKLHPGSRQTIQMGDEDLSLCVELRGPWRSEEIDKVEFVSDYDVTGLTNQYRTFGLGVPLIAVRKRNAKSELASDYYPPGLSFPMTAFLRVQHHHHGEGTGPRRSCVLELYDSLALSDIDVARRLVPLETDLSTPLGYFLDQPTFEHADIATWGLVDPSSTNKYSGVYMLEAYDPRKIPVLMVHGLWSSPKTWTQMVNDLRALPEIRDRYQFWTYLYPSGQPFWISATQLRGDLYELRHRLDPGRDAEALDQMVLIGHSMGGLVSRLQTIDSGELFWRIISDRSFAELKGSDDARERLANVLFFRPNPSVKRCVTIGTPHRGSEYANDYTRIAARYLIALPTTLTSTGLSLVRDNPGLFRDTDLLTTTNSIDSLSPDSPILPVMLNAPKAPWVTFHNVVGSVPEEGFVGSFAAGSDGVVDVKSAHLDDVESEIVVSADHVTVHQHPRTILEVRRILLEHLDQTLAERHRSGHGQLIPAVHHSPAPDTAATGDVSMP